MKRTCASNSCNLHRCDVAIPIFCVIAFFGTLMGCHSKVYLEEQHKEADDATRSTISEPSDEPARLVFVANRDLDGAAMVASLASVSGPGQQDYGGLERVFYFEGRRCEIVVKPGYYRLILPGIVKNDTEFRITSMDPQVITSAVKVERNAETVVQIDVVER